MTQHPVREAGQRWRYLQNDRRQEFVLATMRRREGSGEEVWADTTGREWFGWQLHGFFELLSSPSASPASGPPEGYVPCPKKCGRWKANRGQLMCWRCFLPSATDDMLDRYDRAGGGDWTPPLESKPSETPVITGIDFGVNSEIPAAEQARIRAALVGKPAPPAQEAPKAVGTVEFWQCDRCASDDDTKPTRFDSRVRMYCKPCRAGLEAWTMNQSGTPYAGPERLPSPKLAHSMQIEDPALEDA